LIPERPAISTEEDSVFVQVEPPSLQDEEIESEPVPVPAPEEVGIHEAATPIRETMPIEGVSLLSEEADC